MEQPDRPALSATWAGLLRAASLSTLMACHGAGPATSQPARSDAGIVTRHDAGQTDSGPALLAWNQRCQERLQAAYVQAKAIDPKAEEPSLSTAILEQNKDIYDFKIIPGKEAGLTWDSGGKKYERMLVEAEIREYDDWYENVPNTWVAVHSQSGAISESDPGSPRMYFDEDVNQHPLVGSGPGSVPAKKGNYNAYRRHDNAIANIFIAGLTNPSLAAKLVDIFEPALEACLREGQSLTLKPRTGPFEPQRTKPLWREPPLEITLEPGNLPPDAKLHIEILSARRFLSYQPDSDSDIRPKPRSKPATKPGYRIVHRGPKWTCDVTWPYSDKHPCFTPKKWLTIPMAYLFEERKPIDACQLRATLTGKELRKTVVHNFQCNRHEDKIDIFLDLREADDYIPVQIKRWISQPKSITFELNPKQISNEGPEYRLTNSSHQIVYTWNTGTLEQWQDARWQTAYIKTHFRHPTDLRQQVRPTDWGYFAPLLDERRPKPLPPGRYRYRLECYLMPPEMTNIDAFELISEFTIPTPPPRAGVTAPTDAGSEPRAR